MVTNSRATTAGVSRSDRPEPTTLRGIACGLLCALGLLAGVAQAQTITTTYEYDSLGNRISATNLIRLQDTRVTSFAPKVGLPSDRVAIFGRNLPPGDGRGFTVTFNGIAAEIITVAPRALIVEVPQGARTGPLVVTLPNEPEADLGIFHVEGVIITPGINRIVFAQTIGFVAEVVGAEDQSVTWDVMALPSPFGDDTETNPGDISPDGVYDAPPAFDPAVVHAVLVRASSVELPYLASVVQVRLFGTTRNGPWVSVLAPGPGESGGLVINTTTARPLTSVLVPDFGSPGMLQLNISTAEPLISVLSPGAGSENGLRLSVILAPPPLAVLVPGVARFALPLNVTIADPPVSVEFEDE